MLERGYEDSNPVTRVLETRSSLRLSAAGASDAWRGSSRITRCTCRSQRRCASCSIRSSRRRRWSTPSRMDRHGGRPDTPDGPLHRQRIEPSGSKSTDATRAFDVAESPAVDIVGRHCQFRLRHRSDGIQLLGRDSNHASFGSEPKILPLRRPRNELRRLGSNQRCPGNSRLSCRLNDVASLKSPRVDSNHDWAGSEPDASARLGYEGMTYSTVDHARRVAAGGRLRRPGGRGRATGAGP